MVRDLQTGSIWTHYDGAGLQSSLAGKGIRLPILPMVQTTWAEWLRHYPDGVVLDWYPEFADRYRGSVRHGYPGPGPDFARTVLKLGRSPAG